MEDGPPTSHVGQLERLAGRDIYAESVISQDQIRVLLLEPSSIMDAPIVCNFEVASLASKPAYEALSYAWDSPVAGIMLQNQEIRLCDEPMEIKGNLGDALRRLRFPNTHRRLWVDALCINQSDDAERSYQLTIMPRIYRNAKVVQVWLGEDSGDAKIAIPYLHNVYQFRAHLEPLFSARSNMNDGANVGKAHDLLFGPATQLGKYIQRTYNPDQLHSIWSDIVVNLTKEAQRDPSSWAWGLLDNEYRTPESMLISELLSRLFKRSYFSRRWVLQELHHARRADVRCGSETISWQKMQAAYKIYRTICSANTYWSFKFDHPALWFGLAMRQGRAKGLLGLLKLLYEVEKAKCHDPRDIVYALLGLVRQTSLQPDYSLSISDTWIAVARAAIQEGLAVEMISTAASQMTQPSRCSGLPSWVPDFQMLHHLWPSDELQFDASVDTENRVTCNLNCYGEVACYNGWALIKEKMNDAAVEQVMAAPRPSTDSFTQWCYHQQYPPLPSELPLVMAKFELQDGDLLCSGMKGDGGIVVRAMPLNEPVEASKEQEWVVLGNAYVVSSSRLEKIFRSRRLKLA